MKRFQNELYQKANTITEEIRKHGAKFYEHVYKMKQSRVPKKLLDIIMNSKCGTEWLKEVQKDLQQINMKNLEDRTECRYKIAHVKFEQKSNRQPGVKWTDERKKEHSERMKRFWEARKMKQNS
ncbi:hypothetical protein WA026_018951 [Henosepilachna vigintioctopunctata]|uniref:Uncharacterized protein n=1 Tax=Henosepilachna vigintioctopunctata TaxID=420089 RepID=A0AAW1UGG7_9CUCU